MPVQHLTILHYPPQQPWRLLEIRNPPWESVAAAIEQLDHHEYPAALLSCRDVDSSFSDETSLNIMGGSAEGYALLSLVPGWMYEDPDGSDEYVQVWTSDQGWSCKRRNIISSLTRVLELTRVYFESGSYEAMQRDCMAKRAREQRSGSDD